MTIVPNQIEARAYEYIEAQASITLELNKVIN
jgi:hypothetical protein